MSHSKNEGSERQKHDITLQFKISVVDGDRDLHKQLVNSGLNNVEQNNNIIASLIDKAETAAKTNARISNLSRPLARDTELKIKRPSDEQQIAEIEAEFARQKAAGTYRYRNYSAADIVKSRNPNQPDLGVQKQILTQFNSNINNMGAGNSEHYKALGAHSPWHALNMSHAIKKMQTEAKKLGKQAPNGAIYLSGWMVAALANEWGMMSDQSMHPKTAVVELVRRIKVFFDQQDMFAHSRGELQPGETYHMPIVVDIDAGFGGVGATYLLAQELIKAGASAIHCEDQLSSQKKCGHMGGKVLTSTQEHIDKLQAIRLAADSLGALNFTIISRTDALEATLLDNLSDKRDWKYLVGKTYNSLDEIPNDQRKNILDRGDGKLFVPEMADGRFFKISTDKESSRQRVADRHIAFAPSADLLWTETKTASLAEVADITQRVRKIHPNQKFAYNNSPSFNWDLNFRKEVLADWAKDKRNISMYNEENLMDLSDDDALVQEADRRIAAFHDKTAECGVKFHFITLPTFHLDALKTQELTKEFNTPETAMLAYSKGVQRQERVQDVHALKHQQAVGTDFRDWVYTTATGSKALAAMGAGSTEHQFGSGKGHTAAA